MMILLVSLFLVILLAVILIYRTAVQPMMTFNNGIPGPKPIPFLGNVLEFGLDPVYQFINFQRLVKKYGTLLRIWLGPRLVFIIMQPDYVEELLGSSKLIQKADFYRFAKPWLGESLAMVTGNRWRELRKLTTPAFHFKVLEQYVNAFDKNANILVDKLKSQRDSGAEFNVVPYLELCSLDNVCETAMGAHINAQQGNNLDYIEAVRNLMNTIFERATRPWIHPDFLFWMSPQGRKTKKDLSTLHSFTYSVIRNRRQELEKEEKLQNAISKDKHGSKKLLTFLDMMLHATENGVPLTDEKIREELDTFLFAGYDSVSSTIAYCLWCLATHQHVQTKAFEEQKKIFGNSDRAATYGDLRNMRYLDIVMKESMRLYPGVLFFGREFTEDTKIGEHNFPAGSDIVVVPFILHRNPEHFPEPENFDPERFLPDNITGRHPYCYVPFSAGPRNCIGQKFAVYEMKATISRILRNFEIVESDSQKELVFIGDVLLKTPDGVKMKLKSRETGA